MLGQVARFELRYQLTSPIFWITSIVFFVLTLTLIVSDTIRVGWGGYVTRNSPFTTALMSMVMMVFAIFIATSFASNVVLRDDETGFGPIIRTTRLSKFSYLLGRFTGGFLVSCLVFASVPLALAVGAYWPGIDPETVGPFRLATYLWAYFAMCVPTMFVLAACFFALSTITRSMLTTYVVALVVLMMYLLSAAYLARPEFRDMMSLLDPFALAAFRHATEHWSPHDRNTVLPPFLGPMLTNRALWIAISLALLALTWRSFRQDKPSDAKVSKAKTVEAVHAEPARPVAAAAPLRRPVGDTRSLGWGPQVTLARFDVLSVLRSPGFFVLVGIAFVNAIVGLWYAGDDSVTITRPVTRVMINVLNEQ
ncbi:MAG TPA: ABC transporter permease, partial [Steroidobacteraceae bacterium]|nr:ABC transporter permease [Steroidobacteraceae bacterium]